MLDVELLDVLAQIEALLRVGRDVQRAALRVRTVAGNSTAQQRAAAVRVQKHVAQMRKECRVLVRVVDELGDIASDLHATLKTASRGVADNHPANGARRGANDREQAEQ